MPAKLVVVVGGLLQWFSCSIVMLRRQKHIVGGRGGGGAGEIVSMTILENLAFRRSLYRALQDAWSTEETSLPKGFSLPLSPATDLRV